jgi:hypothetical protein
VELDRNVCPIATALAGIRNTHARPPGQKEPVLTGHLLAMIERLDRRTLPGLRDRAILLVSFTGVPRHSRIVVREQSDEGATGSRSSNRAWS